MAVRKHEKVKWLGNKNVLRKNKTFYTNTAITSYSSITMLFQNEFFYPGKILPWEVNVYLGSIKKS